MAVDHARRRSAPRLALLVVGLTVLVGTAAVASTSLRYGSSSAPDQEGLLEVRDPSEEDLDGDGGPDRLAYVYRHDLGISMLTLASIRNDGPLPVTIVGVGEPPAVPTAHSSLVWAEGLVDSPWPEIVPADPALPFSPTVIEPGGEDAFWVVWRTGSGCVDGVAPVSPGSSTIIREVPLRWTVLGIPRATEIRLDYDLWVHRPLDEPPLSC